MWKECLNGYTVVEYKWVVFARLIFFCFFLITGYVLTNTMLEWVRPAAASYTLHSCRPENLVNSDKTKPAVMQWMKQKSEMPDQVLSSVYDSAFMHINTELILAVCLVESNFNPGVKSSKGAIGLMGIMPGVWLEELKGSGIVRGKRDLFLIPNNIAAGVYVLKKYLAGSKNLEEALFNYVGKDSDYVRKVMRALGEIYQVKMVNAPFGKTEARIAGSHSDSFFSETKGKGSEHS